MRKKHYGRLGVKTNMGVHDARNRYLDEIYSLIKSGEDIVIVSADLAAQSLDALKRDYPKRFITVGIAEQNLISVSCGLALTGKKVIAYTSSPFPVLRGFDQIRNAVSLMKLPISILGIGSGFSIPEYGATHYCIEDMSLMRTCANLKTISISDENIAKEGAQLSLTTNQPLYFRFDKMISGNLSNDSIDFEKGFRSFGNGSDVAIVTNGYFTQELFHQLDTLSSAGISSKIIDVFSIPFDEEKFIAEIKGIKHIITIEEHVLQGGVGSIVLEVLSDNNVYKPIKRIGLNFTSGYPNIYGSREYLLETNGLSIQDLLKQIITICR